jgi:hypothetical protein
MIDLGAYSYTSTRVAAAANISPATLRGYYSRKKFWALGEHQRELAEKGGQPHLYNAVTAMHVVLSVELVRWGMDGMDAFHASASIFMGDDARRPGGCFNPRQGGETLFVYGKSMKFGKIVTRDYFQENLYQIIPGHLSFVVISLTQLEDRAFNALGIEGHSWDGIDPSIEPDTGALIGED